MNAWAWAGNSRPVAYPQRVSLAVAGLALGSVVIVATSLARPHGPAVEGTWQRHRDMCRLVPDQAYRNDRFRAIRGRVTDGDGTPASGAIVRCSRVDGLLGLARVGELSSSKWAVPIEAGVHVGPDGKYDFPHLPVGAYTFFYSAPGLAPAIKDLIVVQDGLGAVLDVALGRPGTLRVRAEVPAATRTRMALVPHRWWPELPTAVIDPGESVAVFSGLGGPLRRGLIVASGDSDTSAWRVVGRYDLDASGEVAVGRSTPPASALDVLESAEFEPWDGPSTPARRLFYAAMSPVALLWPEVADDRAFSTAMADFRPDAAQDGGRGDARGFGPHPFLPVLAESGEGGTWFGWTSDASEFEFAGLPAGPHKVRALDLFGKPTFARGISVERGATARLSDEAWTKPEPDEPDSREIKGFVHWEGGSPAAKAAVIVQHSWNFRLYLRRAEADENGFFRVAGVPGDAPYFAFAMPPGDDSALREFDRFTTASNACEVWRGLTLHPHRISGRLDGAAGGPPLQLIRVDAEGDRVVWSFKAESSGRFQITNVPHGRYRVQAPPGERAGAGAVSSLPLEVSEGRQEEFVRWP